MLKLISTVSIFFLLTGAALGQDKFKPRDANEETAWNIYTQYKQSKANEARLRGAIAARKKDNKIVSGSTIGGLAIPAEDRAELLQWQKELDKELALQRKLLPLWNKKFSGRYGELTDIDKTIKDAATKRTMDLIEFRIRSFPFDPKASKQENTGQKPTAANEAGGWTLSSTKLWSDNPEMDRLIQEYANGMYKVVGSISSGSSVHQWINPNRPGSPRTSLAVTWTAPPSRLTPGTNLVIRAHAIDKGSDPGASDGDFVSFNVSVWATTDLKSWSQIPGGGRDLYAAPRKDETKDYSFAMPAKEYRWVVVRIKTGNTSWGKYFDYNYELK